MAPKRGGRGGGRGGGFDKPMMPCDGLQEVDYCVISDFEADDFIAILILVGHILKTEKGMNKTLHIHISGSKGPTLTKPITHLEWYENHATSLINFLDIINPIIQPHITISLSCSKYLNVMHNGNHISVPTYRIEATNLFLIGPMYDMGIKCNESTTFITGTNIYAFFGYNVTQMYVDQPRFITNQNGRLNANVFDMFNTVVESEEFTTWTVNNFDKQATDWLSKKLYGKNSENVHCYFKPPPSPVEANLENIGTKVIHDALTSTVFEKNDTFLSELKKASAHEPQTFIDFLKKGIPKFIDLWKTNIIDNILTYVVKDQKIINELITFKEKIETLREEMKNHVFIKDELNTAFSEKVDDVFSGPVYDQIPALYSKVPINPGWADSIPIVAFITQHHKVTREMLNKCLTDAVSVFKVDIRSGGGKARKATKNAWIDHVRSVYQRSLGSGNPLSWMQAMKAAKSTYTKRS